MNGELKELQDRYNRLQMLFDVSSVIRSTLDPEQAMALILREAVRITHASSGSVVLINSSEGFLEIHAADGLPEESSRLKLRVGEGITGWVAEFGVAARVGDVLEDPRYVKIRENVQSELAVPLAVGGEVRGVLNVDSERKEAFSQDDQDMLQALADQAAKVIQDTWLYAQLGLKARLFEALVQVSQAINSAVSLDDALKVITAQAARLMQAEVCSLLLVDKTGQWLDLLACHGGGAAYREKPRLSVEESLVGVVMRRGKPAQVEDVQTSSRYQQTEIARREGLVSMLSVPLAGEAGAIGVLNVYKRVQYRFSNEEIRILSALSQLSAVALHKTRLYERLSGVEEALRQTEKLSALGLLAAEVAHEIRNPLTVMKLLYHSLDLRFPAGDPRQRDAEILGEKMDLLNRIVERILAFARQSEPQFQPVDLNQTLEDLNLLLRHKLRQHGVEGHLELAQGLPLISADAGQLEQAFLNLALNAIQAMPSGGRLHIVTQKTPDGVRVDIEDSGVGLSIEAGEAAFGSILNSSKPGGTGLGLAIVRRILDAHHARLEWHSKPGQGTTVSIVFQQI